LPDGKTHFGIGSNKIEEIHKFLLVWEPRAKRPTSETVQGKKEEHLMWHHNMISRAVSEFHYSGYLTDLGKFFFFFFFTFDRTN
jgi:hypothetical protein